MICSAFQDIFKWSASDPMGRAHASAEIIARTGGNISEDYPVKIGDPGEYLVNGAVSAYCNQCIQDHDAVPRATGLSESSLWHVRNIL